MKNRVLFVIGDLDVGGAQWHLVQVLPALRDKGIEPAVYTVMHKGCLSPILEKASIEVIEAPFGELTRRLPQPFRRVAVILLGALGLFRVLRRRPDIVHFFLPTVYLLGGMVSLFSPACVRVMSRRSLNLYQRRHPFLTPLERWLHPKMNAILGNSAAVMRELRDEGVAEDRLGLIYNGIDLSRLASHPSRGSVRAELGIGGETFVLTVVANLLRSKGHADLLTALNLIKDELPEEWVLLCAGLDFGCEADLRQMCARFGIERHVRFLGRRLDVPALLAAADIGVSSSHEEGFSNSVLEGMAAGLPMVVTDAGGNSEAVINGQCGVVVPVAQPTALGDAILTLWREPELRRRFGEAARLRAEQEFAVSTCAAHYVRLYQGLLTDDKTPVTHLITGKNA